MYTCVRIHNCVLVQIYTSYTELVMYCSIHTHCRVLDSKCSKGVGIHTSVMKYLDYEAFSSFLQCTYNSEAFKDNICPKNSKKSIIEEGQGNKIVGWVPEIGGCPTPFSCFS